jgi:histidinol-phosphatase (PHP family)
MKIGDTHVHSTYSTDSETDMEEMVRKALEAGLPHICFTDHIDYDYPVEGILFDFDMKDYFQRIADLNDRYRGKILILAGVELGMQPQLDKRYDALLKKYPFDFVIGSQHLVGRSDPYYPSTFEGKTDAQVYRAYFEETLKNITVFRSFDALGHLDYIVRYGKFKTHSYSYAAYADVIDEILKILVKRNQALELNTAGLRKQLGFPNPSPEVLRRYRELGGTLVTVGSDSHKPYSIGFGFDEAGELLKSCGFTHYAYYVNRKPVFVKL